MSGEPSLAGPLTMLGDPDAVSCEGDACVIPGAVADPDSPDPAGA